MAPKTDGSQALPPGAQPRPITPRRILVIDDEIDTARILRMLLELDGHVVATAHDGAGALDAALRLAPEVVLLDLGMPGMDGYAIARALRGQPALARTCIVALTGRAADADRRRTLAAGFDHHLTKPVERRTLQEMMARLGAPA